MSLATVKLVEPTKARLLSAAIRALIRPDDESVALVDQPRWKAMLAEPDARRMLAVVADGVASAFERQADLISVLSQAASAEPEAARLEQQGSSSRRSDLRTIVEVLAARNELRADLDVEGATDIMWAFASPRCSCSSSESAVGMPGGGGAGSAIRSLGRSWSVFSGRRWADSI